MRRAAVPSVILALLLPLATASAASQRDVPLKVGDAVDVLGTRIACFALKSGGKPGIACVLWGKGKPRAGTFGVALASDGTAVLNRINANGDRAVIFRRRLQSRASAAKVVQVGVGDGFGFPLGGGVNLGCRVLDIKDTSLQPLYRGVKVSCWRSSSDPLPNTYGVSISDRMAGVFAFDDDSEVLGDGIVRRQP